MLLYLDDAILRDLNHVSKNFHNVIASLEYLSMAHLEGKHLITGSRKALFRIVKLDSHLGRKNIALFKRLLQEIPQYGSTYKNLSTYALIVKSSSEYSKTYLERQTIIKIPITYFNDSEKIQPVNLVSENTDDTKLIKQLCRAYSFDQRLSNLKTNFRAVMGGGDQTAKVYKSLQDQGFFTICVVDSDKKHPDDSIGETAKKVESANGKSVLSDFLILNCREFENLLSEKQLLETCRDDVNLMRAVNFIKLLDASENREKRYYLDFKNGLRLKGIYKYTPETQTRIYWNNFNALICEYSDVDKDCVDAENCSEKEDCLVDGCRVCRSIIMYSLGDNICNKTVNFLEKLSPLKLYESLCWSTKELWLSIGSFVFAWSCSGNRIAV